MPLLCPRTGRVVGGSIRGGEQTGWISGGRYRDAIEQKRKEKASHVRNPDIAFRVTIRESLGPFLIVPSFLGRPNTVCTSLLTSCLRSAKGAPRCVPLSSEHGTIKIAKARFWPWHELFSGRILSGRQAESRLYFSVRRTVSEA